MVAVAADIALAHRRFKHREEDVGLLGCRVEDGGPVWFNRVGTFGVACAAFHFARLASLLGRLVMRLSGQAHVYQLLFADDLKMVAAGEDKYDRIWHMLICWLMFGTPFKWPKFRGGVCLEFVGFYMDYCKFEVGPIREEGRLDCQLDCRSPPARRSGDSQKLRGVGGALGSFWAGPGMVEAS